MTAILVSALLALLLVLLCQRWPVAWLSIGVGMAVLIPDVVTRTWFVNAGNLARIHPSTWVFAFGALVTVLRRPRAVTSIRNASIPLLVGAWLVMGALVVTHQARTSIGGFSLYYAAPVAGVLAVWAVATRRQADLWRRLVPVLLALAVVETALGVLQYVAHSSLVFAGYYTSYFWWRPYLSRANGTFDSPLDLAAFLTMVMPLTSVLRRTSTTYAVAGFLALGVVVTGSRTGVALAAAVVVCLILRRSRNLVPATLAAIVIGLGTFVLLSTRLASSLLARFGSRGDLSTQVRSDALGIGLRLVREGGLTGHGIGYAYTYSTYELRSSFENAYLATAIDLGLLLTGALLTMQLWFVLGNRAAALLHRVPGLLAVVWGLAYSSFVSTSTFGSLSWVLIGLSAIARDRAVDRPEAGAVPAPGAVRHQGPLVGGSLGRR